jgi:coenzyme PQQ precursor peptide PqqA
LKDCCAGRAPKVARETAFDYYFLIPLLCGHKKLEELMAWTTPTLVEICIGLEINGYLPAEF